MTAGQADVVRLTVAARTGSVALVLPSRVPLAEMLPGVVAASGLLDVDSLHAGHLLVSPDGRPLDLDTGLLVQGIGDGATLTLVCGADLPEPRTHDDLAVAVGEVVDDLAAVGIHARPRQDHGLMLLLAGVAVAWLGFLSGAASSRPATPTSLVVCGTGVIVSGGLLGLRKGRAATAAVVVVTVGALTTMLGGLEVLSGLARAQVLAVVVVGAAVVVGLHSRTGRSGSAPVDVGVAVVAAATAPCLLAAGWPGLGVLLVIAVALLLRAGRATEAEASGSRMAAGSVVVLSAVASTLVLHPGSRIAVAAGVGVASAGALLSVRPRVRDGRAPRAGTARVDRAQVLDRLELACVAALIPLLVLSLAIGSSRGA